MKIEEAIGNVQRAVDRALSGRDSPRVLDAGCGSRLPYLSFGPNAHIVGMDVSRDQLDRNEAVEERVIGDIQTDALPGELDVIVCWNVLEHLPRPDLALLNFSRSIREGGIILIRAPNLFSVKGLVTKLTPHRLHVWHYRESRGDEHAGIDDHSAFPTYLRRSMSPSAVKRFARTNGLRVIYFAMFESRAQRALRRRYGMNGISWTVLRHLAEIPSLGLISADLTEYCIVMRKEGWPPGAS